ncbi:MAG TPA: S-methyl-5-thioribose-1-phosphate isomerase, partial [Planctomycetes bacterium]|nr:S-methyl-5-thioribose-1-phosphate isomerase [Planctomycetota bacterium]
MIISAVLLEAFMLKTVELVENPPIVRIIDQRLLPGELVYADLATLDQACDAIKTLAVRGAPAIGITAAYALAREALAHASGTPENIRGRLEEGAAALRCSRPTAVNLFWAIERMLDTARASQAADGHALAAALVSEARSIHEEDLEASRRMGAYGAELIADGASCLTHCNAGGLATGGLGTALAAFYAAKERGRRVHVYVDETRPLLQGARLTAFELMRNGIPATLITDNMAAAMMQTGGVDAVFVGADRVAANGDAANKIGTYGLAVLAKHHGLPFYVVAPMSTFDPAIRSGEEIPIEERSPDEVRGFGAATWAPADVPVRNPAFDVTPNALITA